MNQPATATGLEPARYDKSHSFRLGYRPALDGLRGVSILAVIALHARHPVHPNVSIGFGRAAAIGVDVFFVLSGFLITSLLLEEWSGSHTISLKKFYLRRALRLLPALVVFLAVTVAYSLIFVSRSYGIEAGRDALTALFYSSNWAHIIDLQRPGIFTHTWSLSIEEQFYLAWPILLLWLLRHSSSRNSLFCWVVLGVFLSVMVRIVLATAGADWLRIYCGTDARADSLLLGCLVAALVSSGLLRNKARVKALVKFSAWFSVMGLVFLCFYDVSNRYSRDFDLCFVFFFISCFAALIIMELVLSETGWLSRIFSLPPLIYIGKISYGLYLWHYVVFGLTPQEWPLARQRSLGLLLTASFTLASFYLLERPLLRLKRKFEPVPTSLGIGP
jgi:peptidoglycan/LPS O-acetylase OafA/YrhL